MDYLDQSFIFMLSLLFPISFILSLCDFFFFEIIMEPDKNEKLVPIAYFSNSAEAGMACELLVNNGIDASLGGANFGGLEPLPLPGGFSEIRLVVPVSEAEQAKALFDAFFSSNAEELAEDQEAPEDDNA